MIKLKLAKASINLEVNGKLAHISDMILKLIAMIYPRGKVTIILPTKYLMEFIKVSYLLNIMKYL